MAEAEEEIAPPSPHPPPSLPPSTSNPLISDPASPNRTPMARPRPGRGGRPINLISNHFRVAVNDPDAVFCHYNVSVTAADDHQKVDGKEIRRKVMDKLYLSNESLVGEEFAYDGEKALYTIRPLPFEMFEFSVGLEEDFAKCFEADSKRLVHFSVVINFATRIPIKPIALAFEGSEAENRKKDALRVINSILRAQASKRGGLVVRKSFFHDDVRNFVDIGGGVTACRGFHPSFCTTQDGLSLNVDVSSTLIFTPGPVLDFILSNQGVKDHHDVDWGQAKKMLKNLRVKTSLFNFEFKINGMSDKPCNQQYFPWKTRGDDGTEETVELTVYDYFAHHRKIELSHSAYMPCLDVGKPELPNYLPLELCSLVSLQRYTKALSSMQRASLVEKSSQKALFTTVTNAVRNYRYDDDPMLKACGISIERELTAIEGRVLNAPSMNTGKSIADHIPWNRCWNFKKKKVITPCEMIEQWVIVNFSAPCDLHHLSRELPNCGKEKGIHIEPPHCLIEEDPQWRESGPLVRVVQMYEKINKSFPKPPTFILCVLPQSKNCDIYGPWKKISYERGIVTQCISPTKISDQYLTNLLLKINAKYGGINFLLAVEQLKMAWNLQDIPTMILGINVYHGSHGQSDIPSIASVVGSRCWPSISRYRASARIQSPEVKMIDSLFKLLPNGEDDGIIRELYNEFRESSRGRIPEQIIIFRDGVSESQFNQVLNVELEQIIKALRHLGVQTIPKFTVIVAQKSHHTKLFKARDSSNVPPGTLVDSGIVHPRNYDFYLCVGKSGLVHYHVLLDEIGFLVGALQNLIYSLCYKNQRSTIATSVVAPIHYARLVAAQMGKIQGTTAARPVPVTELPKLHENLRNSMFFC